MFTTNIVSCLTCQLPVDQADAQPIRLLLPTGRHHHGVELLKASATAMYECDNCFTASASDEHIYTVHSCGTTRTVSAATPEAAAALILQDRGWASTRSIAVIGTGARCEFLDCELSGGQLQYSERVDLA